MRLLQPALACLGMGCSDGFARWPDLPGGTESVVLAVECGGRPELTAMAATALQDQVVDLRDCEAAQVSILLYSQDLVGVDIPLGKLTMAEASECATVTLPTPEARMSLDPSRETEFRAQTGLPNALANVRIKIPCPCYPKWHEIDEVELPVGTTRVFVNRLDEMSALLTAVRSQGVVQIYRYSSGELALVGTGTVTAGSTGTGNDSGVSSTSIGGNGTLYLAGQVGRLYSFRVEEGLRVAGEAGTNASLTGISAARDESGEVFAIAKPYGLYRFRPSGVFGYDYPQSEEPTSRFNRVLWLGPSAAVAAPPASSNVMFLEGDQLVERVWEDNSGTIDKYGQPQAFGLLPDQGPTAATFRQRVVKLESEKAGRWEDVRTEVGAEMPPVAGWFESIETIGTAGVLVHNKGGIVRYYPSYGFCEEEAILSGNIGIGHVAQVGDAVVFGGIALRPAERNEPVLLPVFGP